ncbi:hypothetical protein ACEWY4_011583 [Coilia grayii]|uniref:Uncharacterized protein n=1 Tax=Coilia grayii TaxID=363190 RepID=A0ABD1JY80_9TELE
MSTSNLPPLRNLPHWSRVGALDKTRYPRLHPKDYPSNAPQPAGKAPTARQDSDMTRIASLEKDVVFLQQQHKDTLGKLHKEIDVLKRLNKGRPGALVLTSYVIRPNVFDTGSLAPQSPLGGSSVSEQPPTHCADRPSMLHNSHSLDTRSGGAPGQPAAVGGALISLSPLRVHSGGAALPRPPTLRECEAIIQQLCHANSLQVQELCHLKSMLRELVLRKEVSAGSFSKTKADFSDRPGEALERFPKIPQKSPKRLPQGASGVERVVLPSISPSCSSLTERQRRAQHIHKTRLRKPVNS